MHGWNTNAFCSKYQSPGNNKIKNTLLLPLPIVFQSVSCVLIGVQLPKGSLGEYTMMKDVHPLT